MDEKLLSIIIPVYNVEYYLKDCIGSVLNCDDEVEIILVDDGSQDSSGSICDTYAEKKNITVIHKENGGLSDARNTGLRAARGRYIFFIDSDDYVFDKTIEKLNCFLKNTECEILLFNAEANDDYYTHKGLEERKIYTGLECIECQLKECRDYPTTVWLGVYSREYLIKNDFWFEKGLLHEDELWTQKVLISAEKVCCINKKLYYYRERKDSITDIKNKDNRKNIADLIYIFGVMFTYTDEKVQDYNLRKLIKANIVKRYLHMTAKFELYKYPDLEKQIDKRMLLRYAGTFMDRIRALILLISTRLYCKISKLKE